MDYLATLDICYGPVNTLPEAIADANLQKRGFMVTDATGRLHFGPVVRFKDEPRRARSIANRCSASTTTKFLRRTAGLQGPLMIMMRAGGLRFLHRITR